MALARPERYVDRLPLLPLPRHGAVVLLGLNDAGQHAMQPAEQQNGSGNRGDGAAENMSCTHRVALKHWHTFGVSETDSTQFENVSLFYRDVALLVAADRPATLCKRIDLVACARVVVNVGRAASVVSIVDVDQAGE